MAKSTFAYVTYIRTTPEKLWSAHRARTLEFHRGGVRRLADGHLQTEVPAGDRLNRSANPYRIEIAYSKRE